ncbi:MAG: cytochrome c-type biogenesis protein CcmH, partial [Litoreibacter sp.]|nr:cytochrome c-type biogenesis protein CcmH [Litoreibacter sp.]
GDFVLFNPPWKPSTYALWIGPFAILALGFIAVFITLYRKRGAVAPSLSAEEQKKLDALLKDKS